MCLGQVETPAYMCIELGDFEERTLADAVWRVMYTICAPLRCWAYITIVKLLRLSVPARRNRGDDRLAATAVGLSVICPE